MTAKALWRAPWRVKRWEKSLGLTDGLSVGVLLGEELGLRNGLAEGEALGEELRIYRWTS